MAQDEIEHMWKVASNDPNHDTNWHDPVVIAFAKLVAAHTLMNIDPSKFISWQEGFEAGVTKEREACAKVCEENATDLSEGDWDSACNNCADLIRARSNT